MTARSDPVLDAILEDFLTRRENHEKPSLDEYLTRHPGYAEELRRFISDLDFVDARLDGERGAFFNRGLDVRDADASGDGNGRDRAAPSVELPAIGRFEVIEELGSGSQGVVYKAKQLGTRRIVALKIIREGAFASAMERRRFENEIQLASQLKHPNIVAVFECGQDQGRDYFAMEYVEGVPLDAYLGGQSLEVDETVRLFLQVCDGVNYAHQHGIIHRDLKPTNVIVDSQERAHILDFGLAKRIVDEAPISQARMTQVGSFAGTWYYASPEQVRRDAGLVDVRSDVYALGVILYEALTDAYPYTIDGEDRTTIARHILETTPLRPSAIRADIDDDMDTILLRALQKDPGRRYQSAAAFGEDLRRYLAGEAVEAKRDSHWYILRKTLRRYRWQAAAALAAAVVLVAFAVTVTILYADATAAQATTEVRSELVRNSQQYLVGKLDELHRLSNVVAEVRSTTPAHSAIQRLQKPFYVASGQLFPETAMETPPNIDRDMRRPGTVPFLDGETWLNSKREWLDAVEAAALSYRIEFPMAAGAAADWIISELPRHAGEADQASKALVAKALLSFHRGDEGSVIRNLLAARSLALDLGDGRTAFQVGFSIAARMRIYEALLYILETAAAQGVSRAAYIHYALSDPPLASFKNAVVSERLKLSQFFEGATRSGRFGGGRYLDLDTLEARFPGFAKLLGFRADGNTGPAVEVSVDELSEGLERFTCEVQAWEDLPLRDIAGRDQALRATLVGGATTRLLVPLLPNIQPAMVLRGRADSMRSATLLAALVCRFHQGSGQWPARLSDAVSQDATTVTSDPYTELEFGYRIVDDKPMLYSFNDDGLDNGGTPGAWGDFGTDVVLFQLGRPADQAGKNVE